MLSEGGDRAEHPCTILDDRNSMSPPASRLPPATASSLWGMDGAERRRLTQGKTSLAGTMIPEDKKTLREKFKANGYEKWAGFK